MRREREREREFRCNHILLFEVWLKWDLTFICTMNGIKVIGFESY